MFNDVLYSNTKYHKSKVPYVIINKAITRTYFIILSHTTADRVHLTVIIFHLKSVNTTNMF